jgi:hypothetical protein
MVPPEVLFRELLLLVGALNLFESGRQWRRLQANRRSLGPRAAPRADGATKGLVHARILTDAGLEGKPNARGPFSA